MSTFTGKNNGIYYSYDSLSTLTYGTILTQKGAEINCSQADTVKSFNITYNQPTGTNIFMAFNTGGNWFKLNSAGNAVNISTATPTFADLAENGNTIPQLLALTNIPAFANKLIRVIIGLSAEQSASSMPRIKFSLNGTITEQLTQKTEYSPVYELGEDAAITNITYEGSSANGGSISLKAQAELPDGTSTGWLDPSDIQGIHAKNIQLRALFSAPTIGSSLASLSEAEISYYNSTYSAVQGKGDIITISQDWHMNISQCRVNLRHSPLELSTMKVYTALRKSPILVLSEQLGIGSGSRKTFQMKHSNGIKYDTVKVYYDGVQIFSGWELNGEVGRITCSAGSGVIVSCSYEYGWDEETWHELTLTNRYSLEDYDESEYRLDTDLDGYSVCAIKISLATTSGSITGESLGNGTGNAKTYKLKRKASKTPTIYSDGSPLDGKNYRLLDDPKYIRIAGPAGKPLTANYKWISETPKIYQLTAVFSA